jgi:hypothetical protein
MTPIAPPATRTNWQIAGITVTTRLRLLMLGAAGFLLALITIALALNAYGTSYELFRGIIEVNSTTVDASENALQDIAQTSQAAADYALLTSDTPLYEQAQNDIFRSFSSFRDEMFILRANLQSPDENTAFITAETFTFSSFWRAVSALVAQRSNDAVARQEYLDADNHVRTWINPALQRLENLNFQQMAEAGERAGVTIISQVVLLAIPAIGLGVLLTYLSFMVRRKVHRYVTPGIDAAMVLAWLLVLIMLLNLLAAPGQLNTMIQDSYRSVSAASRTLVDANLANRAESSELLDLERADSWNARFDDAVELIALRMCGQPNCLETSFLSGAERASDQVVRAANDITPSNSEQIEGIIPLIANVTFDGEATALDNARKAFQEFRAVNTQLRDQIAAGNIDDAVALNTEIAEGTSQEAFDRFVAAMDEVRDINRSVFDEVGQAASQTLQTNRILFGLVGYAIVAVLLIVGVYHRYREL